MRTLVYIVIGLILASCAGAPKQTTELPEILCTVSSDALTISYSPSCKQLFDQIDSLSPLRSLQLDALKREPIVLSKSYLGKLESSLSIAYKPSQIEIIEDILGQSARLKLSAATFNIGEHNYLVISSSEALISAIKRHIYEGTSILDAPAFKQAALSAEGKAFAAFRCGASSRYIPRSFLQGIFSFRATSSFTDRLADWLVLAQSDKSSFELHAIREQERFHYTEMLASLPQGCSRLGTMIPDSCQFALSLPTPQPQLRAAYEHFCDANIKLNSYNQRIASLKNESGKSPLAWEKELGIEEIALISIAGENIVLLRTSGKDKELRGNPYHSFVPALYGSAFALADDSFQADTLGWKIIGSQKAVQDYLKAPKSTKAPIWPSKKSHLVIHYSGYMLEWSNNEIKLWNSGQ